MDFLLYPLWQKLIYEQRWKHEKILNSYSHQLFQGSDLRRSLCLIKCWWEQNLSSGLQRQEGIEGCGAKRGRSQHLKAAKGEVLTKLNTCTDFKSNDWVLNDEKSEVGKDSGLNLNLFAPANLSVSEDLGGAGACICPSMFFWVWFGLGFQFFLEMTYLGGIYHIQKD